MSDTGQTNPARAAVFSDLEGTLVTVSVPRLSMQIGRKMGLIPPARLAQSVALAAVAAPLPGRLKRRVQIASIGAGMAGRSDADVAALLDALTPQVLRATKGEMIARLHAHAADGLPLVIISAGLHEAVARIADALGGRGEGTRLVHRGGRYSGRLDGPPCMGEGKAERARRVLADLDADPAVSYAYGDTASDIPFLRLFGHPHAVDPDAELEAEARRRGWPILRTTTEAGR